ncbi:MAG: trypsin-like serine peptidase [Bacteriovorax sp.]
MNMKIILSALTMAFTTQSVWALNVDKGIYGEDNRRSLSELDPKINKKELDLSRSVLAQVPKWRVCSEDKENLFVSTKSLSAGMNFCAEEKFSEMPLTSSCTAFLVGPDLILTAGHCVQDKYECQKNYWVLDYDDASGFIAPESAVAIKKKNVVTCSQVLSWSQNPKLDYALIKINRKLLGRTPLAIRRTGKIKDSDSLYVIGHPMGLPKVLADNAVIRNNSLTYTFVTDADTFSGNSGSPVFNARTHVVEGILVRGSMDFSMDLDLGCNRSYHCLADECAGETVQRTSVLPLKLIPKI